MSDDDFSKGTCPPWAPVLGYVGVACALLLSSSGAMYGLVQSIQRNRRIPALLCGVLGVFGISITLIIQGAILAPMAKYHQYSIYTGIGHLVAGLCCGGCNLIAGWTIGYTTSSTPSNSIKMSHNRAVYGAGHSSSGDMHDRLLSSRADGGEQEEEEEGHLLITPPNPMEISSSAASCDSQLSSGQWVTIVSAAMVGLIGYAFAWILCMNQYVC